MRDGETLSETAETETVRDRDGNTEAKDERQGTRDFRVWRETSIYVQTDTETQIQTERAPVKMRTRRQRP